MEICKNKVSGRYFIYIEETDNSEALLVTPDAQIMSLKLNLFQEIQEYDKTDLQQESKLSAEQVRRLRDYEKRKSDAVFDRFFEYDFEQMSSDKRQGFISKLLKIVAQKESEKTGKIEM